MKKYTDINIAEAMKKAAQDEGGVFMIVPVTPDTTVREFREAEGFVVQEPETEVETKVKTEADPPKKNIDHGKIVALYTANPPRSVSWIADEIGCSYQTVVNHLKKEGIYKGEES